MIEMLIRPRKAERRPWEMFFIGLFYASISFLLVTFVFGKDFVLSGGSGLLLVIFTVISCLPFIYFIIKLEEGKDVQINDSGKLIKEHSKALVSLMWLFLGFVVAFSFWYIVMPETAGQNFNFQVKTFCAINSASNYDGCLSQHGISVTGSATGVTSFLAIFSNNIYVLIFTLLFSLVFGAGAIFILVWNASVIASAVGIFAKGSLSGLPIGLMRYMVHGIPEIAAYFVGALAGGIVSVAIIRKDLRGEGTWKILQDALILVIIAIFILIIAGLLEVYLTPSLF
ncbi:MAG: stage II sporulation protein M [Candidatus Pacearchaeota archaeon]